MHLLLLLSFFSKNNGGHDPQFKELLGSITWLSSLNHEDLVTFLHCLLLEFNTSNLISYNERKKTHIMTEQPNLVSIFRITKKSLTSSEQRQGNHLSLDMKQESMPQ